MCQIVEVKQWTTAKLRHVGQKWDGRRPPLVHGTSKRDELGGTLQRLGKDGVSTCRHVHPSAVHSVIESVHPARIRPGHDDEIGVMSRSDSGTNLGGHFFGTDELLPRQVAAALRHDLIFQMNARRARFFKEPHGALHVQRLAEAGVGVAEQGQRGGARQGAGVIHELRQREQTDVRDRC